MKVIMTIVQPRAKDKVRSWETTAEYLVDWGFSDLKNALDLMKQKHRITLLANNVDFVRLKEYVKLIN